MKPDRLFPVWRVALLLTVLSSIAWLGSANVRILIGNDLLQPGTLEFDQYLPPDAEREIYRLLSIASIVMIVAYLVTLVSSIVFLATGPFRFKDHPWLLMSAILFYLFVPVEIFTIVLDVRMIYDEFFTTADNAVFRELFLARVGALAGAPLVAMLCYYTIIGLAVFQPFRKRGNSKA
jgi:amino acid transporter